MPPLYSVILPVRDDPLVHEAIRSVLAQTLDDLEVVVVDDGSSSPVGLEVSDPRVRVLRHDSARGPGAARNTGIRSAVGQYIAFLDSDDLYLPRRLELAQLGHETASVVIVRPGSSARSAAVSRVDSPASLLAETIPTLGITSVERGALLSFDERYLACQDIEWWIRVVEAGLSVAEVTGLAWTWRRGAHVRLLNSPSARLSFSYRLLEDHASFFRANPAALSFRLRRIAMMERREGNFSMGRDALIHSVWKHPQLSHLAEGGRLLRESARWGMSSPPIPSIGHGPLPPVPRSRAKAWVPHVKGSQESRIRPTSSVTDAAFRATSRLPRPLRGRLRRAATIGRSGAMQDADTAFGVFRSPLSDTRILAPYCFEPLESAIMCRLIMPGTVAIDIGANLGWYTNLMAERVGPEGHVVAVEPDPMLARNLAAVAVINDREDRVTVLEAAVLGEPGTCEIVLSAQSQLNHVLGPDETPHGETLQVRAVTISDVMRLAGGSPDFLKIDVEGVEPIVLQGLLDWLHANPNAPPNLMFEFEPVNYARYGTTGEEVLRRLGQVYDLFFVDLESGGLVPLEPSPLPGGRNLVAVPSGGGAQLLRVVHGD